MHNQEIARIIQLDAIGMNLLQKLRPLHIGLHSLALNGVLPIGIGTRPFEISVKSVQLPCVLHI